MRRSALLAAALTVACATPVPVRAADADSLVGIHFWGLKQGTNSYYQGIDDVPAQMLDSRSRGAWDVEVVNTHGDPWQKAEFFQPLFNDLYQDKKVSIVTRLEYQYGKTVPAPSTIATATWAGDAVDTINKLNNAAHIWQLGNEPNLIGEGNGWANNQVTPGGYASIYKAVRDRIQTGANVGAPGRHQLLVAPVSPGGVISGVRWKDGNQWLGETLDAIRATGTPVDGVGLHAYGGGATAADTLTEFRRSFAEQVAVVDAKSYTNVPLYITEWNTYADPASNPAAQEAKAAEFARSAFKMLDRWNRTPGNHNVVSAGWFVYDMAADDRRWDGYSLEYWKDRGNPAGSTGDLFTAYSQAARAGYKAGLAAPRPLPAGVHLIDDFETNDGHFTWTPTQSPTSVGASTSSSKVR